MRLVIKVGTNVLLGSKNQINLKKIQEILKDISLLCVRGHEVILVSSGAIAYGQQVLPKLDSLHKKQAWAALGQPALIHAYGAKAKLFKMLVAQCLVLKDDFTERERYENFVHTVESLLAANILPIINENDVVAMSDLTVGDNDLLAAIVAVALNADRLVILTNQKGLFTSNPDLNSDAKLIKIVENVDAALEKMISSETSSLGRGGMLSKIRAAKHAAHAGITTVFTDGREKNALAGVFLKGSKTGTLFQPYPIEKNWAKQKRWLVAAKGLGQLVIDEGAAKALRKGSSLLFPGVAWLKGQFGKGEVVEVITKSGVGVAYGKVNYSAGEIQDFLRRKKDSSIKPGLEKEVIHRDHMAVL
ncbi:MAG: glutamate 5-kinase [Patescibacteria group bacterium]